MTEKKVVWFPAKEVGIGWAKPTVWQGWCVQVCYLLSLVLISYTVDPKVELLSWSLWAALSTSVLIVIYYLKGDAPNLNVKPIDKGKLK